MLKTREEVYKWLLEHPVGFYRQLEEVAGKSLANQLELLGYVRRGTNRRGLTYSLTNRGRRAAKTMLKLVQLEGKKTRRIRGITRFEDFLSKI